MKRKPGKKRQLELDLELEKLRLLESYVEGESNIDWSQLETSQDVWNCLCLSRNFPLLPKEEWLKNELSEYAQGLHDPPAGKVQDPREQVVIVRQKFLEAV